MVSLGLWETQACGWWILSRSTFNYNTGCQAKGTGRVVAQFEVRRNEIALVRVAVVAIGCESKDAAVDRNGDTNTDCVDFQRKYVYNQLAAMHATEETRCQTIKKAPEQTLIPRPQAIPNRTRRAPARTIVRAASRRPANRRTHPRRPTLAPEQTLIPRPQAIPNRTRRALARTIVRVASRRPANRRTHPRRPTLAPIQFRHSRIRHRTQPTPRPLRTRPLHSPLLNFLQSCQLCSVRLETNCWPPLTSIRHP
jgi:hypothetical protein